MNTISRVDAAKLKLNEIGRCSVELNEPISYDGYKTQIVRPVPLSSSIALRNVTVGAGMILQRTTSEENRREVGTKEGAGTLAQNISAVTAEERAARFGQQPATLLITGFAMHWQKHHLPTHSNDDCSIRAFLPPFSMERASAAASVAT